MWKKETLLRRRRKIISGKIQRYFKIWKTLDRKVQEAESARLAEERAQITPKAPRTKSKPTEAQRTILEEFESARKSNLGGQDV